MISSAEDIFTVMLDGAVVASGGSWFCEFWKYSEWFLQVLGVQSRREYADFWAAGQIGTLRMP